MRGVPSYGPGEGGGAIFGTVGAARSVSEDGREFPVGVNPETQNPRPEPQKS